MEKIRDGKEGESLNKKMSFKQRLLRVRIAMQFSGGRVSNAKALSRRMTDVSRNIKHVSVDHWYESRGQQEE